MLSYAPGNRHGGHCELLRAMKTWPGPHKHQSRSVLTKEVGVLEDVQLLVELFRRQVEFSGLSLQSAQLLAGLGAAVLDNR